MKSIQQTYITAFIVVCLFFVTTVFTDSVAAQNGTNKEYQVEIIIFEPVQTDAASEPHDYTPPKAMRSDSEPWLLEPSLLSEALESLEASSDYVVSRHLSWGVESLPYQDSATYTVLERHTQGYIKVYADQLLFANIDLEHKGFRMLEKRRLKLNEKHYFDHPKFGLLMQVSRLEQDENSADEQSAADAE